MFGGNGVFLWFLCIGESCSFPSALPMPPQWHDFYCKSTEIHVDTLSPTMICITAFKKWGPNFIRTVGKDEGHECNHLNISTSLYLWKKNGQNKLQYVRHHHNPRWGVDSHLRGTTSRDAIRKYWRGKDSDPWDSDTHPGIRENKSKRTMLKSFSSWRWSNFIINCPALSINNWWPMPIMTSYGVASQDMKLLSFSGCNTSA